MPKSSNPKSYRELNDELAAIVDWFESDSMQVDEAVAKYEQALKLIDQIETYLKNTQNSLRKLSVKLD